MNINIRVMLQISEKKGGRSSIIYLVNYSNFRFLAYRNDYDINPRLKLIQYTHFSKINNANSNWHKIIIL